MRIFAHCVSKWALLFLTILVPTNAHLWAGHFEAAEGWRAREDQTGVFVLEQGWEALAARAWMIEHARDTVDSMVFIWDMDEVGVWATEAMLRAADRGVRVRILIDDFTMGGEPLETLLALSAHQDLEIRIFNPKINVGVSIAELIYNLFFRFGELNRRMHNKTFVMDGIVGLSGGRNMANEYFGHDDSRAFQDRDILVIGEVAGSMEENFQKFWESPLSRPIEALVPELAEGMDEEAREEIYRKLREMARGFASEVEVLRWVMSEENDWFYRMLGEMVWTRAVFVSDPPERDREELLGRESAVPKVLGELIRGAQKRITIQTPYFVLPRGSLQEIDTAVRRGVEVRVSTNSLLTTDNVAAFSGYARQRQALLETGYMLRELRPDSELKQIIPDGDRKKIHLHAKTMVIDGKILFIGTPNVDPRSMHLHSEEGVIVYDEGLASEVERRIERLMTPENSWDPAFKDTDAEAGPWLRLWLAFLRRMPIKPLL
jgi:cardiolipin synthase C